METFTIELVLTLAALFAIATGIFVYQKKTKEDRAEKIPPSSRISGGNEWPGDVAHRRWREEGTSFHFKQLQPVTISTEQWLSIQKIWDALRKSYSNSGNPEQGDWWGRKGRDCKYFAYAMRKFLREMFGNGAVRFATVYTAEGAPHAVLLLELGTGTYVIDEHFSRPMPWRETKYVFGAIEGPNGTWKLLL